jgi:hypothetical protein
MILDKDIMDKLNELGSEKVQILVSAILGDDEIDEYENIKTELAHNIMIDSLHKIQSDPNKMEDKKIMGEFIVKMEVVKDMLVNL